MNDYVFISYSSLDKPIADAVVARLESSNIRCWIAPRDILPGNSWAKAIIDGIDGCRIVVIIFSTHSNSSDHVMNEIERAVSEGKIIIPMRIEDIKPSGDMELFLTRIHWLDAITPPLEDHIATLSATIHNLLNTKPPVQKPTVKQRNSHQLILKIVPVILIFTVIILFYFFVFNSDHIFIKNSNSSEKDPANHLVAPVIKDTTSEKNYIGSNKVRNPASQSDTIEKAGLGKTPAENKRTAFSPVKKDETSLPANVNKNNSNITVLQTDSLPKPYSESKSAKGLQRNISYEGIIRIYFHESSASRAMHLQNVLKDVKYNCIIALKGNDIDFPCNDCIYYYKSSNLKIVELIVGFEEAVNLACYLTYNTELGDEITIYLK